MSEDSARPLRRLRFWLPALLQITNPRCQHYMFIKRVLGEPTVDALVMSAQEKELMTKDQMRFVAARWGRDDSGYVNVSVAIVGCLIAILGVVFICVNGWWLIAGIPLTAVGLLLLAEELSQ